MKRLRILLLLFLVCAAGQVLTAEGIYRECVGAIKLSERAQELCVRGECEEALPLIDEALKKLEGCRGQINMWLNKVNTENALSFGLMAKSYCAAEQKEDAAANLKIFNFYLEIIVERFFMSFYDKT